MLIARKRLQLAAGLGLSLFVGTYALPAAPETDLVVGAQTFPSGSAVRLGLVSLTTRGDVVVSSNSQVVFKAGSVVTLSAGFSVQAGGSFTAATQAIESDGDGIPDLLEIAAGLNPDVPNLIPGVTGTRVPEWWAQRGVLTPGATADDFAAVNQGQVKNILARTVDEMQATLPGGAGAALLALVQSWYTPGLTAEYFPNIGLAGLPSLVRNEGVDFDWGMGSPAAEIPSDQFSARWSGELIPAVSGDYLFETVSDDGVRLWINGQLIIDQWNDHNPTAHQSLPVAVIAGQRCAVKLEFYENGGGASISLKWKPPGASTTVVIPAPALRSAGASAASDDYRAINIGQLKNVAAPFYDRLIALGYANQYPWLYSTTAADDYALANAGQVKALFSLNSSGLVANSNDNGVPDVWEYKYLGHLMVNKSFDTDGDGISDYTEFLLKIHPSQAAQVFDASLPSSTNNPAPADAVKLQVFTP